MSKQSAEHGRTGGAATTPPRSVMLLGEEREPVSLRWFDAGCLRFAYHNGGIRYLLLGGREVLRGIAFIIRDHNWVQSPRRGAHRSDQRREDWKRQVYVNYLNEEADEGIDRIKAAYALETYARLTALKAWYDPKNLFRMNQNILPDRWI